MNTSQVAPFQQQLLTLRTSLLAQIAQQRGGSTVSRAEAAAEQFGQSQDSPAQVTTERDLALAIDERELAELSLIESALARIEAGTYGECTDCGVKILAARLMVTPEAPRCITCQEKTERRQAA